MSISYQGQIQDFVKGRGGVHLRSTSQKRRGVGCPGGRPTLGPMLKSLYRGQNRGAWAGPDPLDWPMHMITSKVNWPYRGKGI